MVTSRPVGVEVLGPAADADVVDRAAVALGAGGTVVLWDPDPEVLGAAVRTLPRTPPGRLSTWAGEAPDEALDALIVEMLDPRVK